MALEDRIEAVKKVSEAFSKKAESAEEAKIEPQGTADKERFDALMNAENNDSKRSQKVDETAIGTESKKSSSLMEEVRKLNTQVTELAKLGPEDLRNQSKDIIAQIENVKANLNDSPDIKKSYQNVLQNRLSHIDDSLKIALSQAGIEYAQAQPQQGFANPVQKFLGYLTQGQYQLEHLNETIEQLSANKTDLHPAKMLAIQIKLGQVSLEIELFTSCLNKALESTKTIMNVQV